MFWNNTKRQVPSDRDRGKERCKHCDGRGVNRKKQIYIEVMCHYCGGRGCVDWIDHMTGNPSPRTPYHDLQKQLTIHNIHALMHEIKMMLASEGIDASVDIRQHPRSEFELHPPLSKLIKKEPNISTKFKTLFSI